jgi:ribonuclease BN (tRNA processing enzyme)
MKTTGISYLGRGNVVPKSTNRGELALAFIGAGGAFTKPGGRGETNLVLVHGNTRLAIDCGRKWPEALPESTGLTLGDIDAFFVSHCHADHANGLATAAQECRWVANRKPGLVLPRALEPHLWDETLKGGLAWDTSPPSTVDDYFRVIRPEQISERAERVTVGELKIEIFRTRHAPGTADSWRDSMVSYGFYLPQFGAFVSMDTRFDRELVEEYAARGAEWFFHDATRAGNVHATVAELETLPDGIKSSMVLMHTPDNFGDEEAAQFAGQLGIPGAANRGDAFLLSLVGAV